MNIKAKLQCFIGHHDWRIYMHNSSSYPFLWIGEKCRECGRTRNFVEANEEEENPFE